MSFESSSFGFQMLYTLHAKLSKTVSIWFNFTAFSALNWHGNWNYFKGDTKPSHASPLNTIVGDVMVGKELGQSYSVYQE